MCCDGEDPIWAVSCTISQRPAPVQSRVTGAQRDCCSNLHYSCYLLCKLQSMKCKAFYRSLQIAPINLFQERKPAVMRCAALSLRIAFSENGLVLMGYPCMAFCQNNEAQLHQGRQSTCHDLIQFNICIDKWKVKLIRWNGHVQCYTGHRNSHSRMWAWLWIITLLWMILTDSPLWV